jgi:indole-3-glycerol phosphate synthase
MSTTASGDFLAAKATRVRQGRPEPDGPGDDVLRARCRAAPPAPSLAAALRAGERVAVMAEYKRRSPSAGPLAVGEDPATVAAGYRAAGASALSVLTDTDDFGGTLDDLSAVAANERALPVLRKDFIVDGAQLLEARVAGAAAALLIVAMLSDGELRMLLATAREATLECLVEVHSEAELERAVAAGATLLGINNRDLRRLVTDLGVTERLAPRAPPGAVVVSESGIRSPDDVRRVRDAGAHAVLVGEALLRSPARDRGARLAHLAGVPR